jgi:NAD/NADP transhydrogenase alpha subunit
VLTLTASGSVSDFSENDISSLQQKVANAAGVDKSLVTIRVAAASVRITATLSVPASTTADQVQTSLSSSLGNADAASIALGVTVEETPSITVESTIASVSSSNLNVPLIVGIATGALVCVVLSAGACVVMHRRRRKVQQQREQQSLAYLVAGHDLAGQSNAERRKASVSSLSSNKL